MEISWDASQGKGPWTLTVAAINHAPITLSMQDVPSSKDFSYNWSVPLFSSKDTTQALVAVADSSGNSAGVSSLQTITPPVGGATCGASTEDLDFVWYPTPDNPTECADWKINWQTDKTNAGVSGTVSFSFLPEKGNPLTVSGGSSKATGALQFQVPFDANTKMAVIANDGGKYGTGGVGSLYTVGTGKGSCKTPSGIGNGLPSGGSVVHASASSSAAAASSTAAGASSVSKSTATNDGTTKADSASSSGSNDDHSGHGGTAAGAAVGSIAAIIILVALIFWWIRRRRRMQDDSFYGGAYGSHEKSAAAVSPWRWSVSPHAQGVTTGKTQRTVSGWFRQTFERPGNDGNVQARSMNMADAASTPAFRGAFGHQATESYSSSSQLHQNQQQIHQRNASITAASGLASSDGYLPGAPGDDFSVSSPYTSVGMSQSALRSSSRTLQSNTTAPTSAFAPSTPRKLTTEPWSTEDDANARRGTRTMSKINSVQTVVPDDSLFPPPRPALGQRTKSSESARGSFNDGSSVAGTSDDARSVSSRRRVVPDSHLFPPPRPEKAATGSGNVRKVLTPVSERSMGTPVDGYGAGVGSYAGLNRHQQGGQSSPESSRSPFADPSTSTTPRSPQSEVSMLPSPGAPQHPTSEVMMGGPAPIGPPSGTNYIPPIGPNNTSVFDPYAHMSSYWQDKDDMQRKIREAGSPAALQRQQQQQQSAPAHNPLQAPLAAASTSKSATERNNGVLAGLQRTLQAERAGSNRTSDLSGISGDEGGLPYL